MLENKVALITGAAMPRGIGFASALALAKAGAKVVIVDHPKVGSETLDQAKNTLLEQGHEAIALAADVCDREQIDACVEQAVKAFGPIDILVNNAGVGMGLGPFLETQPLQWQKSWDVNVMGIVNFCQGVLPSMVERKSGSIINTASVAGLRPMGKYGAYATTKYAVRGLTKTLAQEFARYNIRVNAICPGIIDTEMNDLQVQLNAHINKLSIEGTKAMMASKVSLGRFASPGEVGNVVAFLASDASSYLTGIDVPICGGFTAGI